MRNGDSSVHPPPPRRLLRTYVLLRRRFGHRRWWPADTPFEVAVGAVLTQNTNWRNVERAVGALRTEGWLEPARWRGAEPDAVAPLIRSAGYFNLKARRLIALVEFLDRECAGRPERLGRRDLPAVRRRLLAVAGVGPETADSVLLYAAGAPTFVIDAYTRRVLVRHGWADPGADYETLRSLFMRRLPRCPGLYNDFHAQLVEVGKQFCRPDPLCRGCPLRPLLPGRRARPPRNRRAALPSRNRVRNTGRREVDCRT